MNRILEITCRKLLAERLERAIGVIYLPETELQRHFTPYFHISLMIFWFDETRAAEPLARGAATGVADTYPFGI